MSGFPEAVLATIQREKLLPESGTFVCGVSGGADSVALLLALRELSPKLGCRVVLAHLDHALRKDSREDAAFCRDLARELGVKYHGQRLDWYRRTRPSGANVEAESRRIRYEFLARVADGERGIVAVGHTADDRLETFLAQLLRGAGARGLSLPRHRREDGVVRPLLDRTRDEVLAFLEERGAQWRTDPTNLDGSNLRSRLRRDVVPLLTRENPDVARTVSRTATQLGWIEELLDDLSGEALATLARAAPPGEFSLDGPTGRTYHPIVLSSVLRAAVRRAGAGEVPGFDSLERLAGAWRAGGKLALDLPGGVRVSVDAARVSVARPHPHHTGGRECRLSIPGMVTWPGDEFGAGGTVRLLVETASPPADPGASSSRKVAWIDADRVRPPMRIRGRRPGDRYRPLGLDGSVKVQDLFVDRKIPREQRESVPLVVDEKGILWIPGFRVDRRGRITEKTRTALRLELRDALPADAKEEAEG